MTIHDNNTIVIHGTSKVDVSPVNLRIWSPCHSFLNTDSGKMPLSSHKNTI